MIDIFKEPVVEHVSEKKVTFTVNGRRSENKTGFIYTANDVFSMSTMSLANKLSNGTIKSSILTSGNSFVMSAGDTTDIPEKDVVLFGCQVYDRKLGSRVIRALTGNKSYENVGLEPGFTFDSRILLPWCMEKSRSYTKYDVVLIPRAGRDTEKFRNLHGSLASKGVVVARPDSHILIQLDLISSSKLVVTSSLSVYILADAMNVPVYMFHTGENYNERSFELEDYFSCFERKTPELLDFSRKIAISSMPETQSISKEYLLDKVRQYLDLSPFDLRKGVFDEIKGYFNEI